MKTKIREFTPLIAFLLAACSAPAGSQAFDPLGASPDLASGSGDNTATQPELISWKCRDCNVTYTLPIRACTKEGCSQKGVVTLPPSPSDADFPMFDASVSKNAAKRAGSGSRPPKASKEQKVGSK